MQKFTKMKIVYITIRLCKSHAMQNFILSCWALGNFKNFNFKFQRAQHDNIKFNWTFQMDFFFLFFLCLSHEAYLIESEIYEERRKATESSVVSWLAKQVISGIEDDGFVSYWFITLPSTLGEHSSENKTSKSWEKGIGGK